ncbi:3-deoxy-D-manno-octulosonic acid transferase [Candidatus Palauibacter irciniicola]|uniref:3-deoxy-D-manno-octulosonic acid transferase n=1 Tax=Candidatus Palauibacter irciniicola TaxID=3056733 RepID=UPI003B02E17B
MNAGARLTEAAAGVALAAAPLLRRARPDIARAVEARRRGAAELAAWGRGRESGPLVWLHGASAGELLGAAPAIRGLRGSPSGSRAGGRAQLLVTHGSPSGRAALAWLDPDHAGPPPLDRARDCDAALAAVRPGLLVFAKLDVWPGLVAAAARAGVPAALINGTVRDGSRRSGALARRLFRASYARLDAVGAASPEDAARLEALGVRPGALTVTGDAAFDLALERADRARADGSAARFRAALGAAGGVAPRLVAGSTWPADERALLDAAAAVRQGGGPGWQLVIAPHEPTAAHVDALVASCTARGERVIRWSEIGDAAAGPDVSVIVFDEVGRLAELYAAGDVAYVGGGLGGTGLHNVLEPAAAGLPVVFGPRHDRADARALASAGGGLVSPAGALADTLAGLARPPRRRRHARAARAFVEAGAGAAARTADLLRPLWP